MDNNNFSKIYATKQKGMLLSVLIIVLLFNVMLQIWLLYTTLNNAMMDNKSIAIPALITSFLIFLVGVVWLYFLPADKKS